MGNLKKKRKKEGSAHFFVVAANFGYTKRLFFLRFFFLFFLPFLCIRRGFSLLVSHLPGRAEEAGHVVFFVFSALI